MIFCVATIFSSNILTAKFKMSFIEDDANMEPNHPHMVVVTPAEEMVPLRKKTTTMDVDDDADPNSSVMDAGNPFASSTSQFFGLVAVGLLFMIGALYHKVDNMAAALPRLLRYMPIISTNSTCWKILLERVSN